MGSLDTPKPHEGPPPSSLIGIIARGSEPTTPLTEKDVKERRAKMLLENLRIKKWTDMFAKWDTCVASPCIPSYVLRLCVVCVCM